MNPQEIDTSQDSWQQSRRRISKNHEIGIPRRVQLNKQMKGFLGCLTFLDGCSMNPQEIDTSQDSWQQSRRRISKNHEIGIPRRVQLNKQMMGFLGCLTFFRDPLKTTWTEVNK